MQRIVAILFVVLLSHANDAGAFFDYPPSAQVVFKDDLAEGIKDLELLIYYGDDFGVTGLYLNIECKSKSIGQFCKVDARIGIAGIAAAGRQKYILKFDKPFPVDGEINLGINASDTNGQGGGDKKVLLIKGSRPEIAKVEVRSIWDNSQVEVSAYVYDEQIISEVKMEIMGISSETLPNADNNKEQAAIDAFLPRGQKSLPLSTERYGLYKLTFDLPSGVKFPDQGVYFLTITAKNISGYATLKVQEIPLGKTIYKKLYELEATPRALVFIQPNLEARVEAKGKLANQSWLPVNGYMAETSYNVAEKIIASVSHNGVVRPLREGKTEVIVSNRDMHLEVPVAVCFSSPKIDELTVSLERNIVRVGEYLELKVEGDIVDCGGSGRMKAAVFGTNIETDDSSVLRIDRFGEILALNRGKANIIVRFGNLVKTLPVTVTE